MKTTAKNRLAKIQQLIREKESFLAEIDKIDTKLEQLLLHQDKTNQSATGGSAGSISYNEELHTIFSDEPERVFTAKSLTSILEKKHGEATVSETSVKAALNYAHKWKKFVDRVGRGKYKYKQPDSQESGVEAISDKRGAEVVA